MPIQRLKKIPRLQEYKLLFVRIGLAYVFYFLSRALFYLYNKDLIEVNSLFEFLKLAWYGLAFDTTAILYINSLFIILSLLPLYINTRKGFQTFLLWLYFVTNLLAYATNFVDFIYYRFNFGRSTIAASESIAHEENKWLLLGNFIVGYWHVFLLFFGLAYLWVYLYKKRSLKVEKVTNHVKYWTTSVFAFVVIVVMAVGGIRGDFKKSTRPINLVDANRFVNHISQADVVLNTPFAIIRTINMRSIKKLNFVSPDIIAREVKPIKQYRNNAPIKPNIVIFILESYGNEYISSFNKNKNIPGYKGYSPFVDSLAQHSLIFTNAYANGYKSIHGMSSIIAGIPSFKDAFTSSPYAKQDIQSLVSVLKGEGYTTSFYHGAPNGSMGFLGFGNILGYDHYYGKTEYNNDADFDGVWGIWDEPFFQYFNKNLSKEKQPFFATLFSVSSHEPYKVPEKYKDKFPKGDVNIHQPIGYTDYALRRFFDEAKKQPWFNNTIFVLVADHGNTIFYDEYKKIFNKNTVPILFYSPSGKYVGVNDDWAQQIDIYPTLLDMIGYEKPFRSWGRSLIGEKDVKPFVMRYSANMYQFMGGHYICTFDGNKVTGFYDKDDKGMTKNLIGQRNAEMDVLEIKMKAFLQDYMERIIDKKLNAPQ